MNFIFLDLDGVITSVRSALVNDMDRRSALPYYVRATQSQKDPVACKMIKLLVDETDSQLVISSSQRKHFFENGAFEMPKLRQYIFDLIGTDRTLSATPILGQPRGVEIQEWLDSCPYDITGYVILDDDSDVLSNQLDNFVQVSGQEGFSAANFFQASKILRGVVNG